MCQAMVEYDQGNYSRAVELLQPIRYRLNEIGGSDAQVRRKARRTSGMGVCRPNRSLGRAKTYFLYLRPLKSIVSVQSPGIVC